VEPVPDPLPPRKFLPGIELGISGSVARNSDHYTTEAIIIIIIIIIIKLKCSLLSPPTSVPCLHQTVRMNKVVPFYLELIAGRYCCWYTRMHILRWKFDQTVDRRYKGKRQCTVLITLGANSFDNASIEDSTEYILYTMV
jgi:hypothetical protein